MRLEVPSSMRAAALSPLLRYHWRLQRLIAVTMRSGRRGHQFDLRRDGSAGRSQRNLRIRHGHGTNNLRGNRSREPFDIGRVLRSIAGGARSLKDKSYGRLAVPPAESEFAPALGASGWQLLN
jgi:hypothetical protein